MDYDDLVDQFIVNDPDKSEDELCERHENEKVEEKRVPTEQDMINLSIHLKSLIQARQINRQTRKLENVKDRNKKFELKEQQLSVLPGKSGVGFFGNNERRRRLLKAQKVKTEEVQNAEEQQEQEEINEEREIEGGGDEIEEIDEEIRVEDTEEVQDAKESSTTFNPTELIPCRLELDYEGYKLSDVFLLPSHPPPPQSELEIISSQLCQEYDLPADLFQNAITKCLKDQVEEWHVYQGALEGMKVPYEEIGAVPLRLDIIVGLHRLEDQLEVTLDPKESNTETMLQFVNAQRSPDSRLLPETDFIAFKPLILHNLLEQLMLWRKAIVFGGFHRDPRSNNLKFHDGDVAVLLNEPSANTNTVRRHFAHTNTFTPILSMLTVEELDKLEAGRERESRRRRRTGPAVTSTTSGSTKKSTNALTSNFVNNLTGTVRSPPRTLPTPTSYRGTLHRIQSTNINSDDEDSIGGAPRKRGRRAKH